MINNDWKGIACQLYSCWCVQRVRLRWGCREFGWVRMRGKERICGMQTKIKTLTFHHNKYRYVQKSIISLSVLITIIFILRAIETESKLSEIDLLRDRVLVDKKPNSIQFCKLTNCGATLIKHCAATTKHKGVRTDKHMVTAKIKHAYIRRQTSEVKMLNNKFKIKVKTAHKNDYSREFGSGIFSVTAPQSLY